MSEILLVGGPHDGSLLSSKLGAPFLWTDGRRCFRAPAGGRALYKRMGADSVGGAIHRLRYQFIGHRTTMCVCGVYRLRAQPCSICGSTESA